MSIRIINADVMEGLAQLPDESVHCVVTSPPYWGLRDYGVDGQIGREPTLEEHVARIVSVFREVRRVLRPDGTMWFNYGDAYATGTTAARGATTTVGAQVPSGWASRSSSVRIGTPSGLKTKDLMMLPARIALALQADGWWVRKEIIWHKPNPMPESCQDRPTSSHEKVYLMTKAERYFYDAAAVREHAEYGEPNSPQSIKSPHGQGFTRRAIGAKGNANGFRGGSYVNGKPGPRTSTGNTKPDKQRGHSRRHAGFNERWDAMSKEEQTGDRLARKAATMADVAEAEIEPTPLEALMMAEGQC